MTHHAAPIAEPSITTPAPIHDTRGPVSTAAPNLWERIAIACRVKHYSLAAAVACSKRRAASAAVWRCNSAALASARHVATFQPLENPMAIAARPAAR